MAQSETTASFGYWVRRRRQALDLTQADLAQRVNCATITIVKIERDERRPSRQMAMLLADQLAVPDAERSHFVAMARGEQAADRLPLTATPVATLTHVPRTNLPTGATPFVGRQAELEQLTGRLADPACRLLTLLGPGGFGKTRLALRLGELALDLPATFHDGVYFVALEGIDQPELVVPAIAAALGFTFYEQGDEERQLLSYLAPKRLLLILDSAEAVLDAGLAARILGSAGHARLLVTTREALNLHQEWLYPVGGMAVDGEASGDSAAPADAVALFEQCARRARPDFDWRRELPHIRQICRLVDGAPLAIELAAAWLKAVSCEQVAAELGGSSDLLATGHRDIPARHRSMYAVLDQSWRYLTADEQRAFRELSVFEGGFQLAAARAVANAALPILAALVEKSMLYLERDGRYRIHTLLRQLGAEQLAYDADEQARCCDRHAAYFLHFLAERTSAITGQGQQAALAAIQADLDNIRAAWLYAAGRGRYAQVGSAMHCLFRFLWMRCRYAEGSQLAGQARAASGVSTLDPADQLIAATLLAYGAQFAIAAGAYGEAQAALQIALAEAVRLGDLPLQARCYYAMGLAEQHQWHADEALNNLHTAYALFQQLDDNLGTADAVTALANAYWDMRSDIRHALRMAEEGRRRYRALGNLFDLADVLNIMGVIKLISGEIDQAETLYGESLAAAQMAGNQMVEIQAAGGVACVAWAREEWDVAIALSQQRLQATEDLGHDYQVKLSLYMLCGVYASAGRYAEVLALLDRYPTMFRTSYTALAQIAAGAYAEAMSYMPQETANKLATQDYMEVSRYGIAWARLLESNCALQLVDDAGPPHALMPVERISLAGELLTAIEASSYVDPVTRNLFNGILPGLRARGFVPAAAPPPVADLVQVLLAIRLA